ncbi:N1-specific pseudouridine methyltransferase NEP1 [Conexivisphaera calida]|uniref:Ribosomal RNA small subunit methyltransferase Nep1 n=1 Tax=Conexivisphaera calida TaxID=1874277 RepID=A0A4P2VEZ5_9ARCH|nr:N1-specific pseudouridine methyltransferase NEP1 [Conexivisphaera calida]
MIVERLVLVIVEAAVELVPRSISDHPSVRKYAELRGMRPTEVILDRSYHHAAMRGLDEAYKRGRPDISYHILLDAVDSPLYGAGMLSLYLQTRDGMIAELGHGVRLPRSYHRFVGLLEDLYRKGAVTDRNGKPLMRIRRMSLKELFDALSPDTTILLREEGVQTPMEELAVRAASARNPLVGIGGFPAGDFSHQVLGLFPEHVSLGRTSYSASLLACRLVYEVEKHVIMRGMI